MKKIMFIGSQGVGKTTLIQNLKNEEIVYKKTQALVFGDNFLDTPGEYLEHKNYLNSLLISSFDYDLIGFLQAADDSFTIFSPNLNTFFNKEVIGIVTKIDKEKKDICRAKEILEDAGCERIFLYSATTKEGLNYIKEYLEE